MKKHLLAIVFLLVALIPVRGQQVIVNDSTMFISLQVDSLTDAERYFNPLYLIVQKGKEHLKQQLVRGSICDCDTTLPNRRIGIFSVAPNKHVTFSQGNLQYFPAAKLWKFADNQYDYLGVANDHLSPTFRNWVDLFGYSANNTTAPFGISTSTNDADYTGDFVDWGTNWICGDKPNTWRTLDKEEWDYLLHKRHNASQLVGVANISGVNGLIILPDNWVEPAGVNFKSGFHTSFGREYFALHQQFTLEQWSIFEQRGAVFLPASGWRNGKTFTRESYGGHYWSTTKRDSTNAYYLSFSSQKTWINCNSLQRGFSIRLVQDTIVPQVIPDPCMVVKINDTLSINMMCVEGGTMYIGRGDTVNRPYRQRPLRQVTISDFYLGQTEVTQELWLAIMGENPTYFPCDTCLCHPVDSVSIDEVLLFIERLNSLTGYNFRLPTEAEWEYAARGGVRSKGYAYAGSDNVNEVAWCRVGDSQGGTPHPVAQKRPNELGLYDMHGNLWEFVHDKFVDDINIYPSVNPTGPEGMRGSATGCGSAYYSALMPENTWGWVGTGGGRSRWFGFRLALSDQDPFVPITIGKYRFHMMYVQGGTFMMGSDAPDAEPNEKPVHEVILSDYYIGQTEVTQKLWKLVMGNNNNPSANKGDELPVTNITWDEAQVFVEKLSEMTSLHFRLPTEAEWEYAARGGQKSKGYTYAGSNDLKEVAWYNGNSGNTLHAVAQKKPNELGIYDMTGNAWEWCHDWYAPYSTEAQTNPQGPDSGTGRVLRSGSYVTVAERCTAKYRQSRQVDNPDVHIGFRLVLHDTIPIPPEPEYVDLGLSVKWATFNVGASKPEDYGDYFAWGETQPKEMYNWATYKWCDGTETNITKYNTTDGKTILEPDDDAAQVHWGDNWRMPTDEEFTELREKCTWTWTTLNGVDGYEVIGPNNKSIFLPATGYKRATNDYSNATSGFYWSNTLSTNKDSNAAKLNFSSNGIFNRDGIRYDGLSIRPVYDDRPPKRIGVFSVAVDKQVSFSQGNLQYVQSTDEWRFAREQYEYIDAANIKDGALADRIDLFGWSANNTTAPFGVSTSTDAADYAGDFVDWGTNTICGDAPGTWRTLSADEWEYLLKKRKNASDLYGVAQVAGVNGMIILPDVWEEANGIVFKSGLHSSQVNDYSVYQSFTDAQWLAMENAGAVFLPALGYRDGTNVEKCNTSGYYWSNTTSDEKSAYRLYFYSYFLAPNDVQSKYRGRSVRLVHDTIVPTPEPEYVDLGLSVKWATFNVGATKPEDYGDYFAWGETEPKETYSWTNYKWCDGTDANITKYNDIDGLTTLLPEDDAATANWGDKWRMPTKEEQKELIDSCQWERVTLNSVIGNKITGPNGNSIFIPAAGSYNSFDNQLHSVDSAGWLYSSSAVSNTFACEISIGYSGAKSTSCSKCVGLTIRPVYDDRVTLTVIPTPADATVGFYYSGGFNVDSNSVKVKKGSSPLYQVAATKKGYLSQGDTLHHITQDTTLYIALRPFSKGTWVKVDTSEFTRVDSFFVSRHQGVFSGPYSSWSYFYAPILPGETYRVRAHAGQHAALWYAASNAPDQGAGIRPTKVACSANGGIVRYIAEEFTIPEGANYLIINAASKGTNLIIERKVPDPCLVVKVNDTLSINLMCVKGGTFRMGVGADNYIERDDPQANQDSTTHLVTLSDYYMAETAVTQGLWKAVMGTDIHDMVAQSPYPDATPKVGDMYPMEYVRLKDALAFIDELNKRTGMHFRLPTETEREYAARGGNFSRYYKYPGSNDYTQVASPYGTPVAQKLPNELGIYDLSGCTREMCTDTWQTTYIYDEHVVNPVGPIQNSGNRTMRGGHIHSKARPFTRYPYTPAWCGNSLGFRIILPTETKRRMVHANGSFFEMCFVEGGTFMMGSDAPDAEADEQPVHEVTLSDYYIGQTEVTQHLWQAVMGSGNNPSATKGNNLPITNISWDEAQQFVERLSELTGMRFRLPTEAEWEYAARGGQKSKGYTYAGSNNADDVAWHIWNTNKLQTVGQLQPNELGIYDMAGNVWEYCSDYYALYEASAQVNPQGPQNSHSGNHVTRGGGWRQNLGFNTSLGYCRVTNRAELSKSDIVGLRIVLEVEK